MLSHDWPAWVELFGDYESLYASNPHFLESAVNDGLGNKPATQLLDWLRPSHWFSGHMHVRLSADVRHTEAAIEDNVRSMSVPGHLKSTLPIFNSVYRVGDSLPKYAVQPQHADLTHFLALGKVGQHPAEYLELLELELDLPLRQSDEQYLGSNSDGKFKLHYDAEWLAITRAYNNHIRLTDPFTLAIPQATERPGRVSADIIAQHKIWVQDNISAKGLLQIPENFVSHAPAYSPASHAEGSGQQPPEYPNRQTAEFAELLQMENKFAVAEESDNDDGSENAGIEFGMD